MRALLIGNLKLSVSIERGIQDVTCELKSHLIGMLKTGKTYVKPFRDKRQLTEVLWA